jgi:hypothetical protein
MPTTAGTYTFTVKATNSEESDTKEFSITISAALTGTVTITGTARVGQTLTANINSLGGTGTVSYQWKRGDTATADGTNIGGATSGTYTLVAADEDKYITVTVTRTGYSGSKTSTATAKVTAAPPAVWTAVASPLGEDIYIIGVAWIGEVNKFFLWGNDIIGTVSELATSPDGITWTAATSPFSDGRINGIVYGDGKLVAIGYGKMAYSTNGGTTWTPVADCPFYVMSGENKYDRSINDITYANDKFVAVGANGIIAYSTNGITWTLANSAFQEDQYIGDADLETVAWGNGVFVTGGGFPAKMATSPDGITWTAVTHGTFTISYGATSIIKKIVWGSNKFVATGIKGQMAYSSNGTTWTPVADSKFDDKDIYAIAWGSNGSTVNKFIAGGVNVIATSSNGIVWAAQTDSALPYGFSTIAYGNGKFVAAFMLGGIAYSATGGN